MSKEFKKVICLTPVYNDWKSFSILAKKIDEECKKVKNEYSVQIIAVDDGSFDDIVINTGQLDTRLNLFPKKQINYGT